MSKTFDLLKQPIQKAIWDLQWSSFRRIQDESISAITQTVNDIIISAPTAFGKTEAAFLPTISESVPDINKKLKIVYISPLKALINDQFSRVENLCKHLDCKITKWHGDASQTIKKKFLDNPSGVLLITPESLESFLINRKPLLLNIFKDVDYYVIDEVHSFVGGGRGDQLKSVLNRLDMLISRRPRRVLLSATIGNVENYKNWLGNDGPILIEDKESGKGIRGSIRFFEETENRRQFYEELQRIVSNGKKLIFGNSKGYLEEVCSTLKSMLKDDEKYLEIHHGSLSKDQREFVEDRLKKETHISVFCTNTLELGIDIGDIQEVVMINPPWSVSSLIQKIGRSGRKDDAKIEFNISLVQNPITKDSHVCDGLRSDLIQSLALVELMLEGWCEPGNSQTNGYSTFVHQLLAYVAQERLTTKKLISQNILQKSFSSTVSPEDFELILENLKIQNYLHNDGKGCLTLGSEGDKLTENYDFYSVFFSPEEWTVFSDDRKLGTIPLINIYREGDCLLFSGKKWAVQGVDFQDKVMMVTPTKTGNPPKFTGRGGSIHKVIHEKMKNVFLGHDEYKVLKDESGVSLNQARSTFRLLSSDENFMEVFGGTGVSRIIACVLRREGIDFEDLDYVFYLNNSTKSKAMELLEKYQTKESLIGLLDEFPVEDLQFEKYDHLLPREVLRKSFYATFFDFKNYSEFLDQIKNRKL